MMNNQSTTFHLAEQPAGFVASTVSPGVYFYRHRPTVHAEWTFADGVEVSFREQTNSTTYYRNSRWNSRPTQHTITRSKPRVFVSTGEAFNLVEDLTNRTRRPHDAYRKPVADALARVGITFERMNWSQRAGCSCPCSPGFILTGSNAGGHIDIWVTLPGAPTVDESKPARQIA